MMTRIIIVDDNDWPIGLKPYNEVMYKDIYRVSALWLTDSETGDILLAQRKWTKHNDPGKWAAAVAGTIEENESYEENIRHEIKEEIGLSNLSLRKGPKQFVDDKAHRFFCQWFFASVDKNAVQITIQEVEVEAVAWFTEQVLLTDVQQNPGKYTPSTWQSLKILGIR